MLCNTCVDPYMRRSYYGQLLEVCLLSASRTYAIQLSNTYLQMDGGTWLRASRNDEEQVLCIFVNYTCTCQVLMSIMLFVDRERG